MSRKIELDMPDDEIVEVLLKYVQNNVNTINLKSSFEYEWHCSQCGQSFKCRAMPFVKSMMLYNQWCPVCTEMICIPGFNDLMTLHSRIAMLMIHKDMAVTTSLNCDKNIEFICEHGHEFKSKPDRLKNLIERNDIDCPVCLKLEDPDLIRNHSEIMRDWDYERNKNLISDKTDKTIDINSLRVGSNFRVWWKCHTCGHKWATSISNRSSGKGCPKCARGVISAKLKANFANKTPLSDKPDVSQYWCYYKNSDIPSQISYNSPSKRWFWCPAHRHVHLRNVRSFVKSSSKGCVYRCPECRVEKIGSLKSILALMEDRFSLHSNVEDVDVIPTDSNRMLDWKCLTCNQVFDHSVWQMKNLLDNGHIEDACPYCSFRILKVGVNDFATTQPELASTLINAASSHTFMENDSTKRTWVCEVCGSTYVTTPAQRVNGVGCKTCSAMKRGKERRAISSMNNPVPQWLIDLGESQEQKNLISSLSAGNCKVLVTIRYPDCNHTRTTNVNNIIYYPSCPKCSSGQSTSKAQEEIYDFVKSILPESESKEVVYNDRIVLSPKELDIYIPSRNMAIEYNGLYWHSCLPGSDEESKFRHESEDKYWKCKEKNIFLLTIFEDQWTYRNKQVRDLIESKLGVYDCSPNNTVYARRTIVMQSDYDSIKKFMDDNHIQGATSGSNYLVLKNISNNEIVACMIVQINGTNAMILRYATDRNVPGGFTKLLTYLKDSMDVSSIDTFSDNCVSNGSLYSSNGFTVVKELPPDYMYVTTNDGKKRRHHKFGYRLERFRRDPNLEYHDDCTESQLAALNGLRRIYDAGKVKWHMNL